MAVVLLLLCGGCGQESERFKATKIKAEQGDADAQHNLGLMYYRGHGMPKDYLEAVKWFRKAAEQGHAQAQFLLASMYYLGRGVPQNDIESYAWCLLARANEFEEVSKTISTLEKLLTAEQIEKGQARALELHRLIEQKKKSAE